jgi:hypothetical protein
MNELDQFIKQELKEKYYVRFMDDGLLVVENKEKAIEVFSKINQFVEEKLKLKLNNKSGYFPMKNGGVTFCGYRIYLDYMLIKRANILRIKKRIKKWNNEWKNGKKCFKYWNQSFYAWKGYASFAKSRKLIRKLSKSRLYIYENNNKTL